MPGYVDAVTVALRILAAVVAVGFVGLLVAYAVVQTSRRERAWRDIERDYRRRR